MTTFDIITEFNTLIDNDTEYTLKEMKTILTDIYNTKNGKKTYKKKVQNSDDDEKDEDGKKKKTTKAPKLDKDGNVKPKRAPTAYNLFVKERMGELKKENPELKGSELMKMAAGDWKNKEESVIVDDADKEE